MLWFLAFRYHANEIWIWIWATQCQYRQMLQNVTAWNCCLALRTRSVDLFSTQCTWSCFLFHNNPLLHQTLQTFNNVLFSVTVCNNSATAMAGAHQNLKGSRDLTTPLSGMVCHPWDSTCYRQPTYQIWNLYLHSVRRYERRYKMSKMGWFG